MMARRNAFYAQSGGVTSVINASACGVIETARAHPTVFNKIYAGRDGIIGALTENLIDTHAFTAAEIARLRYTPGGAFGSCRYKLKSLEANRAQYERLIEVFSAHDIGYFFYNGGNDSMDTAWKVSQLADKMGYPLTCIGIPKTVDNDLPHTDCCPGFGSVAKYVATSIREAGLDVASMASTSTKIFILEVMGRHAGWITAAAGLASESAGEPPHLLLFPEVPFAQQRFLERVTACIAQYGYCTIVVSEGLKDASGKFVSEQGTKDAFGHEQLGGAGQWVAELCKAELGLKYHFAVADYLQRSARHIASRTDVEQAYAAGRAAVEFAVAGNNNVMACIERSSDDPYVWTIGTAPLGEVANIERKLPPEYIADDGFHISDACRRYLQPLILGEDFPPFRNGLPDYVRLRLDCIPRKLAEFKL